MTRPNNGKETGNTLGPGIPSNTKRITDEPRKQYRIATTATAHSRIRRSLRMHRFQFTKCCASPEEQGDSAWMPNSAAAVGRPMSFKRAIAVYRFTTAKVLFDNDLGTLTAYPVLKSRDRLVNPRIEGECPVVVRVLFRGRPEVDASTMTAEQKV